MKLNLVINIRKLIFLTIMLFIGRTGFSQTLPAKVDTAKLIQSASASHEKVKNMDIRGNSGKQPGNDKNKPANSNIKQVKSARPDMSRARGARPPSIERPSGSRIPRGVGRPGGAIKPGKR